MESTKKIIISLILLIANCINAFCNDSLVVSSEGDAIKADIIPSLQISTPDGDKSVEITADSLHTTLAADSTSGYVVVNNSNVAATSKNKKSRLRPGEDYWMPDPKKAMWYSLLLPGAGQIYNRSYWKVPLIYGLGVGSFYVVSFQGRMYREYSAAYYSLVDNDPNTRDYEPIFEGLGKVDESWKKTVLERKMNTYRRYRDLCIFASVLLYVGNALDAFVDAHLYDFSISEDLSMNIRPEIKYDEHYATVGGNQQSLGLKLTLNFGNRK